MNNYALPANQLEELRSAHRLSRSKREADRIKAVVLLATGWRAEDVAEVLQVDANTVRNHDRRYQQGGVEALGQVAYRGSACALTPAQLKLVDAYCYTESGMAAVLHRLGYVYKKPKLVPGKADAQKQKAFLDGYEKLNREKGEEDPIYFMDAVHPQHNPVIACGWIKRGEEQEVRSNTGRKRLNINGAIDLERLEPVVRFDETINSESTIALFEELERINLVATWIYVICDNARYYRSKAVQAYLKNSRIKLVFLPPYAPNLNLIERFWKFFKKKILYNRYFETFDEFKAACEDFFANPASYRGELRSLLTEKFEIIGE